MQSIHDETAVWESWAPEMGQRVRVRISAECRLRPCPGSYYERIGQVGHPEYEDGLTGTVTSFGHPHSDFLANQGHTIDVEYDTYPDIGEGRRARGGTYCALELEPVP